MNKFQEYNTTIITETDKQRVIENIQKFFWNNKPINYKIGKDITLYCNLFNVRCDREDIKKDNTNEKQEIQIKSVKITIQVQDDMLKIVVN